jgi:excisionase family DNA binding protein
MDDIIRILTIEIRKQVENVVNEKLSINLNNEIEDDEILSENQLCERLNLSRTTISRYRKENKIPYLKVGNNIRYEYNKVLKSIGR